MKSKYYDILIENQNFNEFAIWTDFHGDYLCVAPCFNGASFTKKINPPYKLKPEDSFKENITISII